MTGLDLDTATLAVQAALTRAQRHGAPVTVVVVDAHGETVTMSRQDGALLVSPSFARKKAFTSACFRSATHEIAAAQDPVQAIRIMTSDDRLSFATGGVPVVVEGQVVGAVGVAGGRPEDDLDCCAAALEAISRSGLDSGQVPT